MLQKRSAELSLSMFSADFLDSGLRGFFFETFRLAISLVALFFYIGGILLLWSLDGSTTEEQRAPTFYTY